LHKLIVTYFDSENGGLGAYGTRGKTTGAGASAGSEFGFFTGSMKGKTEIASIGLFGFSIGYVSSLGEDWGVVGGYAPGLLLRPRFPRILLILSLLRIFR